MNDYMFEGSENSIFYIFRLNRSYDGLGLVTIAPEVVFEMETWTDELLSAIGSTYPAVSVENSTVMYEVASTSPTLGAGSSDSTSPTSTTTTSRWCSTTGSVTTSTPRSSSTKRVTSTCLRSTSAISPCFRELGQLIKLDPIPTRRSMGLGHVLAHRFAEQGRVVVHAGTR